MRMTDLRSWSLFGIAIVLAGCALDDASGPEELGEVAGESEGSAAQAEESAALEDEPERTTASPEFDAQFKAASAEFDVPASVLKAIAWTETRFEMVVGEEEFEGKPAAFGVMALSGERLARGAELAGVSVDEAKTDPLANVRAAAAYLSALAEEDGIAREELVAWEPVVGRFSAIEDEFAKSEYVRDNVFEAMRHGLGEIAVTQDSPIWSLIGPEYEQPQQTVAAGPDYGASIWRPSPNFNSRNGVKPSMVIIHTCEGGYAGCWGWLRNTRSGASAHYVIREDGREISQLVRESGRAWHIGATYNSRLNGGVMASRNGTSSNNFTIGIEHAGFASQKSFSAGQLDASARLTCSMSRRHGIPRDRFHIVGHGQLQPYNRTDPGKNWPWATYIQKVNQACGAGAAPAPAPAPSTGGTIIVDSNNARNNRSRGYISVSGNWTSSANVPGYYGTGYWWARTASVSDGATFYFYLPSAARKTIDAYWTAANDRSPSAPFVMFNAQGTRLGANNVNQRVNGGRWNTLGTYNFSAGWNKVVLSRWTGSGNVVVADAVRIR
jgi:N-acetyl-anhydromuramyl-L-alanine amidase AmpD